MIEECKGMGYEERLRVLKLTTLETRRRRADLVELFKIMNGLVNVDERVYVDRSRVVGTIKTRGHTGKLFKKRVNYLVRPHQDQWMKIKLQTPFAQFGLRTLKTDLVYKKVHLFSSFLFKSVLEHVQ